MTSHHLTLLLCFTEINIAYVLRKGFCPKYFPLAKSYVPSTYLVSEWAVKVKNLCSCSSIWKNKFSKNCNQERMQYHRADKLILNSLQWKCLGILLEEKLDTLDQFPKQWGISFWEGTNAISGGKWGNAHQLLKNLSLWTSPSSWCKILKATPKSPLVSIQHIIVVTP